MISVIVPAHNEATVIRRSLEALVTGSSNRSLEVIVVCNGCDDETAEVARSVEGPISVLETTKASKIVALNLGDQAARGYPRVYVDADVVLSYSALLALVTPLENGECLASAPSPRVHTQECTALVRAFYRVWENTPYYRDGMIGSGVYALSEEGRARFDRFPDVIADDGYVRALFQSSERIRIPEATVEVWAPRTLESLLKIKTRTRLGFYQLRAMFPQALANERREKHYRRAFVSVITKPRRWLDAAVYVCVNALSRIRARRRLHAMEDYRWDRDESSRNPTPAR